MSGPDCGPCDDTGRVYGGEECRFCDHVADAGKLVGAAARVAADCDELRELSLWFAARGKPGSAEFLSAVACRYEIVAGAYSTKLAGGAA